MTCQIHSNFCPRLQIWIKYWKWNTRSTQFIFKNFRSEISTQKKYKLTSKILDPTQMAALFQKSLQNITNMALGVGHPTRRPSNADLMLHNWTRTLYGLMSLLGIQIWLLNAQKSLQTPPTGWMSETRVEMVLQMKKTLLQSWMSLK